jgi:hypothetical protein
MVAKLIPELSVVQKDKKLVVIIKKFLIKNASSNTNTNITKLKKFP